MIPKAKKRAREVRIVREQRRAGGSNEGHGWAARQARGEGRSSKPPKRSEKKSKARQRLKLLKAQAQLKPGGKSNYARKASYLKVHGGWGDMYPQKPWRSR